MFLLWKLLKLTLTCNWSDGGSGSDDGDGGFGDDGFGGDSGYGDYGGFAGGGSAAGITGNAEQNAGMGDGIGFGGDTVGGGYGTAGVNTNIAPATQIEFNTNFDIVATTTFGIQGFLNGYTVTANRVTSGYLDTDFDSLTQINFGKFGGLDVSKATVSGGTIASHLYGLGLTAPEAISAEAIGTTVVGMLLGVSPLSLGISIAQASAQTLGAYGMLSQAEYSNVQMAIGIASAMAGALHTMEAISTITSNFGYMNVTQKALALTVSAISIKNTISSFQRLSEKYGIEPTDINIADIANLELNGDSSLIQNYEKLLRQQNFKKLSYATKPNEWEIVDKMAGSVMFDAFMAGGDLFSPITEPTQVMASVGKNYSISNYSKHSILEEDFLETTTKFYGLNKTYEQNENFSFSINI